MTSPTFVWAAEPVVAPESIPLSAATVPISITEVQTGSSASASEEFIELHNNTDQTINLSDHAWRLEAASAVATNWGAPYRSIPLSGILEPDAYFVVASKYTSGEQEVQYLAGTARGWFSTGLSATGGHVRLVVATNQPQADEVCSPEAAVIDQVEWSVSVAGQPKTPSLDNRAVYLTPTSSGILPGNSVQRWRGMVNEAAYYIDSNVDRIDFKLAAATPGVAGTEQPVAQIAEPSDPIEIPQDGCILPPAPDPDNDPESPLIPPNTDPNPDDPAPDMPGNNAGLTAPELSELLPNPATPQTDAEDEFIELYNPNDQPFTLAGYVLEAGITARHNYVIPDGVVMAPYSFLALYAADTGLSLANTASQARLLSPAGAIVAASDTYADAKDGRAWARTQGRWQWTTQPTPNAPNVLQVPIITAAKQASAVKKSTGVKVTATKAKAAKTAKTSTKNTSKTANTAGSATDTAATTTSRSPIHPGVLAAIVGFAVLYGAYEYRHDMANKFRRFRENRAARRAARQGS